MERKIYRRMRIYLNESDMLGEKALYLILLEQLRRNEIRGATVIRALTGYGQHGKVRPIGSLKENHMPLIIEAVDEPEKIHHILPIIEHLAQDANCGVLITTETVEAVRIQSY
ncbi:MAG: DUF190 domain-containing protein [Leptospiraceae bacterium]|nr:DUF190 domain-containing protein [Leptospiraceae bacterium]MDW8306410.1 DUF190 domain-containing protein [Leptospiraceae bacterium]